MIAVLLLAAATAAEPVCVRAADPPPGLEAWRAPVSRGPIVPGRRTRVALAVGAHFLKAPDKTPDASDRGGMAPFRVTTAGRYRIALSEAAWIDVLAPTGRTVASTAHAHGPACSGIRKMVDFTLGRGAYVLQLSGAAAESADVLIVPVR